MQWGKTYSKISDLSVSTMIQYPIHFPHKTLSVNATLEDSQRENRSPNEANVGDTNTTLNIYDITNVSFYISADWVLIDDGFLTPLDYCTVHWIAIGY